MRISLYPLDDRPCSTGFPALLAEVAGIEFCLLAGKRELEKALRQPDPLILSIEGFIFGSLVESRKPEAAHDEAVKRMEALGKMLSNARAAIYLHTVLMRQAPSAFTEEEARMAGLIKEASRRAGNRGKLRAFLKELPSGAWSDYLSARKRNLALNRLALSFVEKKLVRFLAISLDDLSSTGLNVAEAKILETEIREKKLSSRAMALPGTDETALLLMTRAALEHLERKVRVYPLFSGRDPDRFKLRYEDRPLSEILKLQLVLAGMRSARSAQDADLLLFVHVPQEEQLDVPPRSSLRADASWLTKLAAALAQPKPCALADLRYANGADASLMRKLATQANLAGLAGYSGWNTAANALGITLSHAALRWLALQSKTSRKEDEAHRRFLFLRFLEDWLYQAEIRPALSARLKKEKISPLRFSSSLAAKLGQEVTEKLNRLSGLYLKQLAPRLEVEKANFPWRRLFDIRLKFHL